MSEELFQSLIRDLEQQKPIRERLAKLKGERLEALKKETEEAIARAKTESSPNREDYAKLREHMISVTRDVLLSSLLEATEGIILSRGAEPRPEPKEEQPKAQESTQSSASSQAPKESLNVFEKNPAPAATQKPAMGFREWVRSQRGQSAPAEGTWNKIVSWFDVQSPNPEQHYDENIWSRPKYWFAYGVYWLMDWWNGWGKKKPASAPPASTQQNPSVEQQQPAPPAPAQSNPEAQQQPVPPAPAKPTPEAQQQAPATSAQQTAPASKPPERSVQSTQPPAPRDSSTTPSPAPGARPSPETSASAKPPESVRPGMNLFDTRNQGRSLLSSEMASNVYHIANQRVELRPDRSFITVNGVNYNFVPGVRASLLIGSGPFTFNQLREALRSINCSIELQINGNAVEAPWNWEMEMGIGHFKRKIQRNGKHIYLINQVENIVTQIAQNQSTRTIGKPVTIKAFCQKISDGKPEKTRSGSLDIEENITLVPLN